MVDVYAVMLTGFATIFSVLFFILGTHEGTAEVKDYAKSIIYFMASAMFSFLCVGVWLATEATFSLPFQFGFLFFGILDFVLIVFNGWKSYLFKIENTPSRDRRYEPE